MKPLAILAAAAVAGCVAGPDPQVTVDLMKGTGSVSRDAAGNFTFRYVVHAGAYRGITDAPISQHEYLIGNYLAGGGHCQNGYRITQRSYEPSLPAFVYSGVCTT